MRKKGQLTTCDRCGATIFSKLVGSEEFDGGYSSRDKFEELPNGWGNKRVGDNYMDLCPTCGNEWMELEANTVNKFLNKKDGLNCD